MFRLKYPNEIAICPNTANVPHDKYKSRTLAGYWTDEHVEVPAVACNLCGVVVAPLQVVTRMECRCEMRNLLSTGHDATCGWRAK